MLALLEWVHRIPRTAENTQFFILPRMRATPGQVLAGGGDCADKSRLLTAMLRQVGIPATAVMCFHEVTREPTHTVVCAFIDRGRTMVVDPAYGLAFPRPDGSGYYGLEQLRGDPTILTGRLAALRRTFPRSHPAHAYDATSGSYRYASSFNWGKNRLTRAMRGVAYWVSGDKVHSWPRPAVLEEPKLFVALVGVLVGILVGIAGLVVRRVRVVRLRAGRSDRAARQSLPSLAAATVGSI